MDEIIITLAPGQAGFYDELTGVHLNLSNKEARILSSANTMGLVKAVKAGKILVVSGSLGLETIDYIDSNNIPPTYYRVLNSSGIQSKSKAALKEHQTLECAKSSEVSKEEDKIEEIQTLSEPITVEDDCQSNKIEEEIDVLEKIEKVENKEKTKSSKKKNAKKKKIEVENKNEDGKGE